MTKPDKIAKKVRALLAIAGDNKASDSEIQNAMNHAHKLMGEYHLSEEDLGHEPQNDYEKVDQAEFNRKKSFVGKKAFAWECHLAHFVSEFVGVPYYLNNNPEMVRKNGFVLFDEKENPRVGKSFIFYGVSEDAMIAAELYDELRLLIATMAVASWGSVYKGDGAKYSQGFVAGLTDQLKKTKNFKAPDSTSMVLVHRRADLIKYKVKKAKSYLVKKHGIKLRKGYGRSGGKGSAEAFSQGKADGKNANVSATQSKKIC